MTRREIQWTTVVRKTEKTEMTENGRVFALMHMLHLCQDNNNNLSEQKKKQQQQHKQTILVETYFCFTGRSPDKLDTYI